MKKGHKIGHTRTSISEERRHRATVERKRQQVGALEALLQMWEDLGTDPDYCKHLNKRHHIASHQLKAMRCADL